MNATTYTNDGETEYELVYDIPEDAAEDHTVYVVEADADDGARSTAVDYSEFESDFEEYEEGDDVATKYLRERARNGHGIQ